MSQEQLEQLKFDLLTGLDMKPMLVTGYNMLAGIFLSRAQIDMTIKLLTAFSILLGCLYVMVKIAFVVAKWRKLNEKDLDQD